MVVGRQLDSIFMVMEYMEHDLKGLSENMRQPFTTAEVRWQDSAGAESPTPVGEFDVVQQCLKQCKSPYPSLMLGSL